MAKILKFEKRDPQDPATAKIMLIADEVDAVIRKYLNDETVDPNELAGVLAHRLGALLGLIDKKDDLWDVCQRVLKRQAKIE